MSDGVEIYTIVQRPETPGRFPVKLVRNPYVTKEVNLDDMAKADARGYVSVTQHCRGCGRSSGDCIPYINERRDGLETLEWIRKQPFYNGEIYLFGGSYLCSVHYSFLDTNPPDVKGAVLMIQDCVRYNILYRNGFFKPGLHGSWFIGMYKKNSILKKNAVPDTFRTWPLEGISTSIFGEYCQQLEMELAHPDKNDPFWQTHEGGADAFNAVRKTAVPTLFLTAFHDIYTEGIFDLWETVPKNIRPKCALVVTPYEHNTNYNQDSNPFHFPNGDLNETCPDFAHEWLEHIRTGAPLSFIQEGKTTFYTLWENKWNSAPSLTNAPTARTWYLNNDRTLADAPSQGDITYLYNPYAPASFKGGCCLTFGGMKVQDKPNSRYDIISFLSEPAAEPFVVEGTMKATLKVKSDRPDTCFYVRLSIVKDDVAYGLRDDITSVCLQHPDYEPGTEVDVTFHLTQHSFKVAPGERLRLDVSSSCYPQFTVHSNRKGPQFKQTGADIAHNTIVCNGSSLTVPTRPAAE